MANELNQSLDQAYANLGVAMPTAQGQVAQQSEQLTQPQPDPTFESGTFGNLGMRLAGYATQGLAGIADINQGSINQFLHGDKYDYKAISEAIAAEQAGTATPEQLAFLDQQPTQTETNRLTGEQFELPVGLSNREMFNSMLQANTNPTDGFIEDTTKKGLEKLFGKAEGTFANKTWSQIQQETIEPMINRESENELIASDDIVKGSMKFADGITKLSNDDNYVDGGIEVASSIVDLVKGVTKFGINNPVDALEMVAGEVVPAIFASSTGGAAGLLAKGMVAGRNVGAGHDAYRENLQAFMEKNGRAPTTEELRDMQAKAIAIVAMESIADKALGKVGEGEVKTLSGLVGNIAASGLKEGGTETAQSLLQATMDQEGLTKEELQQAYGEGAVGSLVGAGGKVAGKPLAAGTLLTKEAAKAAPTVAKAAVKATAKVAPVVAKGVQALDKVPSLAAKGVIKGAKLAGKATVATAKASPSIVKGLGSAVNYVDKTILQPTKLASDIASATTKGAKSVYENATKSVSSWVNKFKPSPDASPADIKVDPIKTTDEVQTPVTEAPSASASEAQRTFYSFRQNQESMTPEQMVELADADNDLTEAQNNELRAAANLANTDKLMDQVSNEIEVGGGNKLSMKEHANVIKQAIRGGNLEGAKQLTAQYAEWAKYHGAKANAFAKSFNKTSLTQEDLDLLGKNAQGKTRSINSKALVTKVANEAAAMQQQIEAIAAYINAVEATDAESNATTAPQQESVSQAQSEAPTQEQNKVEPEQEAKEQPEVGKLVSVNGKPGFITGFDKKGNARVQLGTKSVSVKPEELQVSKHKLNTVDYKGKQYLVTAKGSIMSTASGEIVFKKDNKTRREILAIASGKTPEVIAESVAEAKPEQIVKPEETNEVAEQIDEEPEVVTKKPELPEFSLSKKLLSAVDYNPELPLKEQNLIKHWFKTGKNNSALETVDNFMEALNQDPKVVEAFISDMTDAQKQSFRNFYKFHKEMLPKLDAEWVAKDSYQYKDFTQFMTTDGKLDPNVKTAIILGAYEYLVDKTESSQWKSPDDVKRILGMNENDTLPNEVYNLMATAGDVSSTVWDSMGASAASALNLKPTNDAGMNAKAMLNSSLAAWSRKLLEENDLLVNTLVSSNAVDDNGKPIIDGKLSMTKVNKEKALPLIQGAKADPYVTNEVFGTTKVRSLPEFKPSKAPMKFKGSNQKIPQRMREAITKHNKRPQVVIKAMDSLISQMSQAAIYEMLGYEFDLVKDKDGKLQSSSIVKGKRKSVEAVNRSIENSYQNWLDFREYQDANGGIDTEFFYNHTPATNNRLFLDSRMNPQSDKFHRFLVGSKGWETTVDPKDKKAMDNFMLAVAEGMDIEAAKDTIPDVLEAINKKVNEPVIQEGIQEILNQMNGKDFDEGAINAAITATKMKAHGLAALVAYAQYKQADGKPFTHTLMREGDGITNGVAWGSLQFPDEQGMVQKMERFGMYSNGTTKGFANWKKETKSDDAYQSLARVWEGAISKIQFQNRKHEQFSNAITNFVGSFMDQEGKVTKAGRNAAKPILMTFVYGAGINGILNGYTNFVVDKIYDDIKKLINKPNDPDAYQNVMNASELLRQVTGRGIDMNNLLDFELSEKDHKRLQTNITQLYKDTLETALEQAYPELTRQRKTITEAVNRVYKMFEYEYNKAKNEYIRNLPEEFKGVTDITREDQAKILAKVKNVMPILGTYYSKDDLDSGLELFKTQAVTAKGTGSGAYTAEIKPKTGKSIKVTGKRIEYQDPGVRTMPMTVQSLDASAMYKAIAYNVLNVFDAVGSTQNNFDESLHYINKAFTDISNEYSIPSEVAKMVSRIVDNASPEAIDYAFKEPKDLDNFFSSEQMVNDLNEQAQVYNERKKDLIEGFTYSGQYFAGEDTGVVVKEAPEVEQVVVEEATNAPKTEAELRTLGSSQDTVFTQDFDPAQDITSASTLSTFERLMDGDNTGTTQEHREHLKGILNSLVNKVMQPLKLHLAKDPNTAESYGSITGEDIYIVTGKSSQSTANNQMSAGEVFVHELVHAVTTGGTVDPLVRSELNSLWKYAKKTITPFDLMTDPTLGKDTEEYKIAEARWKHMFEPTLVNGQSNHLAEFVALGLTNAQVMSALSKIPTTKATGAQGFMGKLRQAFENMLKAFRSIMVGTYGKPAKDKVEVIAMRMAGIENQKKRKLVDSVYKVAAPIATGFTAVNNKMKEGISAIENSKTGKQASKAISKAYNDLWKSSSPAAKLLASLMNEAQGRTEQNGVFHDLKRTTQVAQQREANAVKEAIKATMNQAFEGELTDAAKEGITSMLFKTDFVTLLPMLEKMGLDWTTFISDDATQKKVIAMIESQLTNFQKVQAENLGRFMATGENALQGALLNAKNIAQGDTKAEKMIDALASIQALQYTPKTELAKFFQAFEADNDNLDGIRFTMDMHKQFKQDAAKALFQDSEAHIIKGWIPEIHHDGIEFTTGSDKEPMLESLGYVRGDELSSGRYVWANTTGIKQGYIAGILNMGRKGAKGTKVDQTEVQDIGQSIHDTDKASYDAGKLIIKDNKTVPEVDTAGNIVNFRYVMKDSTKAELGANTNFDDIMAGMHASIVTKTARVEGNKQIIQALIDQYYANPNADYVEVSTLGMPKEIRDMVERAFPKDKNGLRGKLLVRPDQQDLLFGYTKYSLADAITKSPELRNAFETIVADTAKAMFGDKAALRIRQGEDILQSFISTAKDIIVVRSGIITIMNTFSNVLLLASQGVSITQAMKDIATVPSYIKQYERDEKALRILKAQVELQTGAKRAATQTKIAELTDNLYNNPVKELIQGGVLTTTFEDLGEQTDFDPITITGEYLKQQGASAKVIDPLVNTINNVTFAQGTKGYNVLSDAARYSDFIARYSLYNHLRNKGMERDAAIGEAMDVFINYDLPTHKGVQYLNDIGFLMFSKYLIRVQKIILKSFRDNPAGVIGAVMFQNLVNLNEGIWKSLVGVTDPTSRISTPVDFTGMFGEDLGSQAIKTVL